MSEMTRRSRRKPTVTPIARHGKLRRSSVTLAILKIVGLVTAVAVVSVGSIAGIAAWDLSHQIKTVEISEEIAGPIPEIGPYSGGFNMLLIGSDSRANSAYSYGEDPESELNDVNILLHVSADHTNAVAISFPRDMYVPIPECSDGDGGTNGPASSQKINTALMYGGGMAKDGLSCAVATVSELTGLSIPFAATITFDGVIEMSNAIGGVPVCVASPIEDEHTELYLDAGTHNLQGVDALKFLRTRYGVGDGSDVTRISSQQVFLSALVRQVKSSDTLGDVGKLYGLAGAAVRNMVFTSSLNNIDTLVQIARALQPIDLSKIAFVQYPTYPVDGGLEPNYDSAQVLIDAINADQAVTVQAPPEDSRGSVADPNAVAPVDPNAVDPATVDPADPNATTPPADTSVVLPDDVLGQVAAESRCTVGRTLDDQ
ncbi:LCP family protein [Herbiconiux sp. L3-i23]|uniref:LCP family protein n=1 Tax=Herbiconiux sp. L3-i23 TaxID=2905871 RepID=UPI0020746A21|nr:LCP family protein [Herbiconiux sp. L3-i23]